MTTCSLHGAPAIGPVIEIAASGWGGATAPPIRICGGCLVEKLAVAIEIDSGWTLSDEFAEWISTNAPAFVTPPPISRT